MPQADQASPSFFPSLHKWHFRSTATLAAKLLQNKRKAISFGIFIDKIQVTVNPSSPRVVVTRRLANSFIGPDGHDEVAWSEALTFSIDVKI